MQRLPAIPIIPMDPYISVWMPANTLTEADTMHWCGQLLPIRASVIIDSKRYRILGMGDGDAMGLKDLIVTPLSTKAYYAEEGVELELCFTTPFLPKDLDRASTPITLWN